jgi:cytochrome P450
MAARDIGWIQMLERMLLAATWTGEVPYILPLIRLPIVQRLVPSFRQAGADRQRFAQFARANVAARIDKGSDDRKDMLTYILESHKKRPDSYTENDVVSESHTITFAGSDTTAIVLVLTIHC